MMITMMCAMYTEYTSTSDTSQYTAVTVSIQKPPTRNLESTAHPRSIEEHSENHICTDIIRYKT
jgi:hypothetical protein